MKNDSRKNIHFHYGQKKGINKLLYSKCKSNANLMQDTRELPDDHLDICFSDTRRGVNCENCNYCSSSEHQH